ncbi:conjugal transfer protein TraD [Dongia sp.]|uniref:conjugal transfer protein TraD n=1 Tax=Dongia sp. TaxID=1977262 RepID=UPI0037511D2F
MKNIEQLDQQIFESVQREQAAMGALQDSVIREVLRSGRKTAKRDARSKRTGRLWCLGVLGEITGIRDEDPEVVLGALRLASSFGQDQDWQGKWAAEGRKLSEQALQSANAKAEPVVKKSTKTPEDMKARKALDWKRIAFGGIVNKAEVANWDQNVLLGVFCSIARGRHDGERMQRWRAAGAAAAGKPGTAKTSKGKTRRRRRRIQIQYPAAIPPTLAAELDALGLKFDRWTLVWRGFASMPVARRLAAKAGGAVTSPPKNRGKPGKKRSCRNSGNRRARSPGDANITPETTNKERKS